MLLMSNLEWGKEIKRTSLYIQSFEIRCLSVHLCFLENVFPDTCCNKIFFSKFINQHHLNAHLWKLILSVKYMNVSRSVFYIWTSSSNFRLFDFRTRRVMPVNSKWQVSLRTMITDFYNKWWLTLLNWEMYYVFELIIQMLILFSITVDFV